jgi:hypothetical protein
LQICPPDWEIWLVGVAIAWQWSNTIYCQQRCSRLNELSYYLVLLGHVE